MKLKNIATGMLSLTLLGAVILPVAAENTTEIRAAVPSTYTLTIPSNTNIAYGSTSTDLEGVLKVTGNVVAGQSVTVSATTNPMAHAIVGEGTINYTLKQGGADFAPITWTDDELRAGLENDAEATTVQLSVAIAESEWNNAAAGVYQGSIVFTAALND